jgi:hypothetical protein
MASMRKVVNQLEREVHQLRERVKEIARLIENLKVACMSTYEQAELFYGLAKPRGPYSGGEIASRYGLAKSHVNNLIRAFHNLDDLIKRDWEANEAGAETNRLFKLAAKPPEAQRVEWQKQRTREEGKVRRRLGSSGR